MTPFIRQMFVVSGVLLTMVAVGMCLSFTTCLLPALQKSDSDIQADLSTSSWIAASLSSGWMIGYFSSSYYMNAFGRRIAFLLDITPAALGSVLMYFSTNVTCLIIARVLEGVSISATATLGCIVIGEYCDPIHRGMFLNLKTATLYLGSTITHMLGMYYHWRTVALFTLIPILFCFVIIWMWPESPAWLASKDQREKCEKAFYWLRGKNENSTKELRDMLTSQELSSRVKNLTIAKKLTTFFQKFAKRNFIMPVIVYIFAAILIESSGRHIFPSYAVQIVAEVANIETPFYYTLYLDILIIISVFISCVLVKIFKRRTLLFSTGAAAFIVLMLACTYLFLQSKSIVPNITWIPIFLFGLYLLIVNLACAPIPLALLGEIFPLEHRAEGTTIAGLLIASSGIIALKITPILLVTVKVYGTFTLFGVIMAMSLVCLYFILPETKDKTLQEIEECFNTRVKNGKQLKKDDEEMTEMIL